MTLKKDFSSKRCILTLLMLVVILSCKTKKSSSSTINEGKEKSESQAMIEEEGKSSKSMGELPEEVKVLHSELSDSVFARIQRTPCFGRCPIYTLTIFKSGLLRYHGEKWAEREGNYIAEADSKKLIELVEAAQKVGFFTMESIYDNSQVTDLPSTITTLSNEEGLKTVINRYSGPENLRGFENFFDELFKNAEWKKESDK